MNAKQEHPLKTFLEDRDLSQAEAAELFECSGSTVSRILKNDRWPSGEMINVIHNQTKGKITFSTFQKYFSDQHRGGLRYAG